jgi:hypothetical protein
MRDMIAGYRALGDSALSNGLGMEALAATEPVRTICQPANLGEIVGL